MNNVNNDKRLSQSLNAQKATVLTAGHQQQRVGKQLGEG